MPLWTAEVSLENMPALPLRGARLCSASEFTVRIFRTPRAESTDPIVLRRSAQRFPVGVSRGTAMALADSKTEDIFNRFEIVSASNLSAGLEKVALHRASKSQSRLLSRTIGPRSGPRTA